MLNDPETGCNGIKGPNYAVGMHLACVYVYSIAFGPFNGLSTSQTIRLQMTNLQKIEGALFGIASATALFLFGSKRQGR